MTYSCGHEEPAYPNTICHPYGILVLLADVTTNISSLTRLEFAYRNGYAH